MRGISNIVTYIKKAKFYIQPYIINRRNKTNGDKVLLNANLSLLTIFPGCALKIEKETKQIINDSYFFAFFSAVCFYVVDMK